MSKSTPLTSEHLAARTARAITAATTAARELGLTVDAPRILHDSFSVCVHLAPAPVVARIPVVLPMGLEPSAQLVRQTRELAACGWLAARGEPIVRPSPLVPPSPVQRDGFSMTFWEWVDVAAPAEPNYEERATSVANLHAALREYPVPLPFMSPLTLGIGPALAALSPEPGLLSAEDLDRARREWQLLAPVFQTRGTFAAAFPGVYTHALHGDSPAYNMLATRSGALHADFEELTAGPIEWDLALMPRSALDAYDACVVRIGLRRIDHDLLQVMNVLRLLQIVACVALIPQLPSLATDLVPMLNMWRELPFAGRIETYKDGDHH